MEFSHKGKIIFLEKNENETLDLFLKRGNFIIKNIDNDAKLEEIIKFSHIYIYTKYYNCVYSKSIIDNLNTNFKTN